MKTGIEAFDVLLKENSDRKHVAILCHDQPDPDCLASAMAMMEIATYMGLESTIYYGGEIAHTQNRVMINVLNIPVTKLDLEDESAETIKESIQKSHIVLIDTSHFRKENCQVISGFVPKDRLPDVVIDHHSVNAGVACPYIHRLCGACATIFLDLLKEKKIVIDRTLATALYLAIMTDTDDLRAEGTTDEDREAIDELKQMIDPDIYLKIFHYPKPLALLNLRSRGYHSIAVKDNLAVAYVGIINPQQRSLMAELCEEILEIEAVETAVVIGLTDEGYGKDKHVSSSFRSRVLAIDTRDFLQSVFGKKNSGGRKGCGAAKVPLDEPTCETIDRLASNEDKKGCLDTFVTAIFETYCAKIREEKEKI